MFCNNCGKEVFEGAKFCAACGAEITAAESISSEEKEVEVASVEYKPKKRSKAKKIMLIVRNSLITLLAVLMFAFSFLPVISIGTSYNGMDFEMQLSTIDSMSILVSSFSEYGTMESPMYDELLELSQDIASEIESYGDITEKEAIKIFKDEINKIVICSIKYALSLEDVSAPISFWFSAIFSLIYMIIAVAFLVISILNLLSTLGIIKTGKRFEWWSNAIFTATPVMLLLLFYTMGTSYASATTSVLLSGYALAVLIVGAFVLAYAVVQRLLFEREKNVRVIIMRGVVAMLALVMMISVLVPVCNGVVAKKDVGMGVAGFNEYSTVKDEVFEKTEGAFDKDEIAAIKSVYATLSGMTAKELSQTAGIAANNSIICSLIVGGFHRSITVLFSFIPLIYIIILMLAAAIMWHTVKYLVTGKENKAPYLVFKILTVVFAAVLLGFVIAFTAVAAHGAHTVIGVGYTVTIGASSIMIASLATVVICLPAFKNKVVCYCDEDESFEDDFDEDENDAADAVVYKAIVKEVESRSFEQTVKEIKMLKELYDIGAITDDEFAAKKAQLLGL